jgi:hypothetical protein
MVGSACGKTDEIEDIDDQGLGAEEGALASC